MSVGENGFRTVAFGGFHRDDVLKYVEKAAAEANQRQDELQTRLVQAEADRDNERDNATKLSEKNAELLERLGHLTQESDRVQTAATEQEMANQLAAQEIASLHEELERLRAENQTLLEARNRLQTEHEALSLKCTEYQDAKEHLADIELCAHRHARELETSAEAQAAGIRAAAEAAAAEMRDAAETETKTLREQAKHETAELRVQTQAASEAMLASATAESEALRAQAQRENAEQRAETERFVEEKFVALEVAENNYLATLREAAAVLDHPGVQSKRNPAESPVSDEAPATSTRSTRSVITDMLDGLRK